MHDDLQSLYPETMSRLADERAWELNDHDITYKNTSYECRNCDRTEELPKIIRDSSPDVIVLYKLYAIGRLACLPCPSDGFLSGDNSKTVGTGNRITPVRNPDNTYQFGNMSVDGRSTSAAEKRIAQKLNEKMHGK